MNPGQRRLLSQHLSIPVYAAPADVVSWLGAVQAQDYLFAKWSVAQRTTGTSDADMDQAFAAGTFLRTHVMRPTWFFVAPADLRWMLALTASRVHRLNEPYERKEGVDDETNTQVAKILVTALEGGKQLTRSEIYALLQDARLLGEKGGLRGLYLLMHAELTGLLCSGGLRGRQHTYALLDDRVPPTRAWTRDESLAELARRFFLGHGPAHRKDFARWSGLTLGDTDAALAMLAPELEQEEIDGQTYWFAPASLLPAASPESDTGHVAWLFSGYDEYLNGYVAWGGATQRAQAAQVDGESFLAANQMIVLDTQVVGVWTRTIKPRHVEVIANPFFALTDAERAAIESAAHRYAAYLDLPLRFNFASQATS